MQQRPPQRPHTQEACSCCSTSCAQNCNISEMLSRECITQQWPPVAAPSTFDLTRDMPLLQYTMCPAAQHFYDARLRRNHSPRASCSSALHKRPHES
eukprot:scaffold97607_cov15-Tisochrysis_lutea.AAC.1